LRLGDATRSERERDRERGKDQDLRESVEQTCSVDRGLDPAAAIVRLRLRIGGYVRRAGRRRAQGQDGNCPNAAPNAKTEFKDNPKGVEITITAKDKADVDEIKKRSKELMEKAKDEGGAKVPHSGTGGGGGSQGRCPIVLNGTDVTVADVEGGSKFTVVAKDPKEVDWVRREAKERLASMQEPGSEEKGAGKMANCPSAVKGSKTAVKEDKGSIVVTVTSKDDAATKDIRERAKKLGEMKHDAPKKGEHGGKGAGAEEGRCPAVIEGTTATVKDVDGGSEITLKPKTAGDLKKLLAEATERAGRFD